MALEVYLELMINFFWSLWNCSVLMGGLVEEKRTDAFMTSTVLTMKRSNDEENIPRARWSSLIL